MTRPRKLRVERGPIGPKTVRRKCVECDAIVQWTIGSGRKCLCPTHLKEFHRRQYTRRRIRETGKPPKRLGESISVSQAFIDYVRDVAEERGLESDADIDRATGMRPGYFNGLQQRLNSFGRVGMRKTLRAKILQWVGAVEN